MIEELNKNLLLFYIHILFYMWHVLLLWRSNIGHTLAKDAKNKLPPSREAV